LSSLPETRARNEHLDDFTMRQANQIDLLHGLVAIPSLSGQEENAVGYLVGQMRARGFEASVDRVGNAVGVKGSGPTKIVLLGHIDTVPGESGTLEDGVLHGRGSCDAKGPLATFVAAAEQATGDKRTIIVVGAVGEESIGSPVRTKRPLAGAGSVHHRRTEQLGCGLPLVPGHRFLYLSFDPGRTPYGRTG